MKIIKPTKKSRPVKFKDIFRVLIDSVRIKWRMLTPFEGRYPYASSISHCQISEDPLRFFVLSNVGHHFEGAPVKVKLKKFFGWPRARTIINPEIIWHGEDKIKSVEGCMSYPDRPTFNLRRWEIVNCKYWTLFGKREKKFYYYRSCLLQHELDHMDLVDPKDIHKNKYDFQRS